MKGADRGEREICRETRAKLLARTEAPGKLGELPGHTKLPFVKNRSGPPGSLQEAKMMQGPEQGKWHRKAALHCGKESSAWLRDDRVWSSPTPALTWS